MPRRGHPASLPLCPHHRSIVPSGCFLLLLSKCKPAGEEWSLKAGKERQFCKEDPLNPFTHEDAPEHEESSSGSIPMGKWV